MPGRRSWPYLAVAAVLLAAFGVAFAIGPGRAADTGESGSGDTLEFAETTTSAPPPQPSGTRPGTPSERAEMAPPEASRTPAAPGTELKSLQEPPERSIWALSPDKFEPGQVADVEFEPYGSGPDSLGTSIVASVRSSEPRGDRDAFPDIVGRNVIFIVGRTPVGTGGLHRAVVTTRLEGDRVVLVIDDVRPVGDR